LAALRQHVEILDDGLEEELPPADLVARTCSLLDNPSLWAEITDTETATDEHSPTPLARTKMSDRPESMAGGRSRFSLMDGLVALGVCLAALAIFFPALAGSRMLAARIQCEDNLRQVGFGPEGRIPGALFGNTSSDAYHMENVRNLDNTTREAGEVARAWAEQGIGPDKHIAFYCGTGWRASETWFYAYLMAWPRISVYDGGWFEWSQDPVRNPIEVGEPQAHRVEC
jgi:rhodanese-related sulfurtransferase